MALEDGEPVRRPRGWALVELSREDLDLLGVSELEERIEELEAEITRCRAQVDRKRAGKAAADAFFSKPG
jgi:uncharacterized small protein (DUF1192 family)